ncbi:MAG: hypothetical protein OYH77_04775 [Pseudomonadota bacterium]|nr:hypothetical protein [Pseudomonadota bacterium]
MKIKALPYIVITIVLACTTEVNVPPPGGGPDLPEIDINSADVQQDALVEFVDDPMYNPDAEQWSFKVAAANDAAVSFMYKFLFGQNKSCDDAAQEKSGKFDTVITISDSEDPGARLLCIRGVNSDGEVATAWLQPQSIAKDAPQGAFSPVDVIPQIANGVMSVDPAANSVATNFKWCVIDGNQSCPTKDSNGEFSSTDECTFNDGGSLPQQGIDLGVADRDGNDNGEFIACVVGTDGTNYRLQPTPKFTKQQTVTVPQPLTTNTAGYKANGGKLVAASSSSTWYAVLGRHSCSSSLYFDNTGTDEITVEFSYLNDAPGLINRERRQVMFSDIVYQIYDPATHDHNAVRQALGSYCRNNDKGNGEFIHHGKSFQLPAGHRVITVFKAKDPTATNYDPKYFNPKGYACVEMRLMDLNNKQVIDKYRCLRRAELALYRSKKIADQHVISNELERGADGEYHVEFKYGKSEHRKYWVVNAIGLDIVKDQPYVKKNSDLDWEVVGDQDRNVPNWLYIVRKNFSQKQSDGTLKPITNADQFQFGVRWNRIDKNKEVPYPSVGSTYKLRIISNSLTDKACQQTPVGPFITKQDATPKEGKRYDMKPTKSYWYCPRVDVLNIKIVK